VHEVLKFLETGNNSYLTNNKELSLLLKLIETMEAVNDSHQVSDLISALENFRKNEVNMYKSEKLDILEMFDFRHVTLLQDLIQKNRSEEAIAALKILGQFPRGYQGASYSFGRHFMENRIYYPQQLLLDDVDIITLGEDARFQFIVTTLASTTEYSIGSILNSIGGGDNPKNFEVDMANGKKIPISYILFGLLGSRITSPNKSNIIDWAEKYAVASFNLKNGNTPETEISNFFDQLLQDSTVNAAPELRLIYEINMYKSYFNQGEMDLANEHYNRAHKFIQSKDKGGLHDLIESQGFSDINQLLQNFPHHNTSTRDVSFLIQFLKEFTDVYRTPKVARFYQRLIDQNWFEADKK